MKLSKGNMLTISFMLFSLFFGAGNLIFPPFLGQNAGSHTVPAMIGFLATAVILPVLGVVVVARFDGLDKLGQQVGPRRALRWCSRYSFTCPSARGLEFRARRAYRLRWPLRRICPRVQARGCGCLSIRWYFSR